MVSAAMPVVAGSPGSGPFRASYISAASATLRHKSPTESRLQLKGYTPARLMRPTVVLSPVTPQKLAGTRTEPPVSVPKATGAIAAATATPEPLLDPPGRWGTSCQGLRGVPWSRLMPVPP